ncbi:flagellin B [Neoasaia chiangmaiensis NBRC 101099]|uniref:Flagellin n=1 Tax=Neoasaia chiangmaiensis TaxID=320497 RepID=A0A1U9KS81_9PROT|nr:flagellin [Neoasaia chiangmaiensis]AQS88744.1 hypothetical protein A0U93_13370 [Neoasaia chiangmaiensis]GBR40875.1 flagellin B [Neoasaia chiangmaiensis NBRC 101099]GEN13704.1 hypothetical protein NCH01_01350 [Neoasaia chiangmaiensis]
MSLSINTNNAAMAALQSLNQTTAALNQTQNRVSTGKDVNSASDNPAVYAISQSMNSQIAALSGVQSGLQLSGQVLNTASTQASNISMALSSLSQSIITAESNGFNANTMQQQINNTLSQIDSYANSATMQGINLLSGATGNGVKYTSISTAQDVNGTLYTQSGFNATSAGLGLAGLNINQQGASIDLGKDQFVNADSGTTAAASNLQIKNTAATASTGTAQNPAISYNFVMDNHGGTGSSTGLSSNATIGAQLASAIGITTAANLTVGTDGTISDTDTSVTLSKQSTDSSGNTTYAFSNGTSITASKDASGNTTFTASTAFDANGNATAQTVVVDVNTKSASALPSTATTGSKISAQTQAQTDLLTTAMSNAGFQVTADANNTLTISGNNIDGTSNLPSFGKTLNDSSGAAVTTDVTGSAASGSQIALATVQAAITKMGSISVSLGSSTNQVSQIQTSVSSLSNALTTGVGALTDADLAAESAKLTSLQTKQQLAIQSLSIANSQSSTLLSLFRG